MKMQKGSILKFRIKIATLITILLLIILGYIKISYAVEVDGNSSGIFINQVPSNALVSGVGTNHFEWGDPANFGTGPCSLTFLGNSFFAELNKVFNLGTITYFNGTTNGGEASAVDLKIKIIISTPSGLSEFFIQTLRLINTPNTSDPIASADLVFLPTNFPDKYIDIDGFKYTVSIIGFANVSGSGYSTLDRFNVLEGGSASAVILGRIGRACVVPGGGSPIKGDIGDFGSCGPTGQKNPTWDRFGKKPGGVLIFDSGEKLEIECSGSGIPSFKMLYTSIDGEKFRVGKCPFEGGCNSAWFMYSGDSNNNGQPDCLIQTRWISRDYGEFNDKQPNPWTGDLDLFDNKLDWAETILDANSTKVSKNDYKFNYLIDHPISCPAASKPEGTLVKTISVDPLLGPETEAFFDEVQERMQSLPPGDPMGSTIIKHCDLNGDNICDYADYQIFQNALGKCREQDGYIPLADGNGDGCITNEDEYFVFIIPVKVDIKPGSKDNPINIKSEGVLTVAILTGNNFDATEVDPLSIEFGPKSAKEVHRRGHFEDVDKDGDIDLVLHFEVKEIGISCDTKELELTGKTLDGYTIKGKDSIRVINCK
jgi:hypothetical protein